MAAACLFMVSVGICVRHGLLLSFAYICNMLVSTFADDMMVTRRHCVILFCYLAFLIFSTQTFIWS